MSLVAFEPGAGDAFTRAVLTARHGLAADPAFSDAGLAALLDRYPRSSLGAFTMAEDSGDWRSWRRAPAPDLDGAAMLRAVQEGRLWLNLRAAHKADPALKDRLDALFAGVEAATGVKCVRRDLGVLISSPLAHVTYHFDMPLVMLLQIRGEKRVRLYPATEPFLLPEQAEALALGLSEEQTPFDPAWDAHARIVDLKPGDLVTWPQNAPHRVENGPMLNISLSVEFLTAEAFALANVRYANGLMRRVLGLRPATAPTRGPDALARIALARAHKAAMRATAGRSAGRG